MKTMNYKYSTVLHLMSNAMLFTLLLSSLSFIACEPEGYVFELTETADPDAGCSQLKIYFRDEIQVFTGESCLPTDLFGKCYFIIIGNDTISIYSNLIGNWNYQGKNIIDEKGFKYHFNIWHENIFRKELDFTSDSIYFDYLEGYNYSIAQLIVNPKPSKAVVLNHIISCDRLMFRIEGELNNHSFEQAKELITAIKVK